jgi:inorganic pyrophosphatase
LDVCEIGLRIMQVGEVSPIKILGTLCLIDEGEADWKMIGINLADPWAPLLNDVDDLEEKLPGTVHSIREWFRTYKIPVSTALHCTHSYVLLAHCRIRIVGRQAGEPVRS